MPVQIAYPLEEVIDEIKQRDFSGQRRVSFESIVFHELNDTARHVKELGRLLAGIHCRINLIRFHPVPGHRPRLVRAGHPCCLLPALHQGTGRSRVGIS